MKNNNNLMADLLKQVKVQTTVAPMADAIPRGYTNSRKVTKDSWYLEFNGGDAAGLNITNAGCIAAFNKDAAKVFSKLQADSVLIPQVSESDTSISFRIVTEVILPANGANDTTPAVQKVQVGFVNNLLKDAFAKDTPLSVKKEIAESANLATSALELFKTGTLVMKASDDAVTEAFLA